MDTRTLGKPDQFSGEQAKGRDWKVVTWAYAAAVHPQLANLMRVAVTSRDPVLAAVLVDEQQRSATRLLALSLAMLCRGPALDLVVNSGADEGLQGWRALVDRYEPRVRSRFAGQLMQILSWDFTSDVITKLEAF